MNANDRMLHEQMLEAIELCRSHVLDTCQFELGDSPNWSLLRTRLLRAFGDRGLEGRMRAILSSFGFEGGDADE